MYPDCPVHDVSLVADEDDGDWAAGAVPAPSPLPCNCYPEEPADVTVNIKSDTTEAQIVGSSCNVLLLYQLHHFSTLSWLNIFLSFICLVYFSAIIVCLVINSAEEEWREEFKLTFHMLEFWGLFVFSVVNLLALFSSPKPMKTIYQFPMLLKFLVIVNVVMSAVPAILMSIDRERFEYVSHNIEYAGTMFVIFVDLVLFFSLLREKGKFMAEHIKFVVVLVLSMSVCMTQLLIWNLMQDEEGEQIAHYLEFSLDLFGAFTTFWFCIDSKLLADHWIKVILTEGTCPPECLLKLNKRE